MQTIQLNAGEELRILGVLRTVRSRTTSRLSDEAIVIASLLHLTAGAAGKIALLDPEMRMRSLFRDVGDVPVGIIFLHAGRHAENGLRWLPRSFLSQAAPHSQPLGRDRSLAFPKPQGLRVFLPALRLHISDSGSNLGSEFTSATQSFRTYEAGTGAPLRGFDGKAQLAVVLPPGWFKHSIKLTAVLVSILRPPEVPRAWPEADGNGGTPMSEIYVKEKNWQVNCYFVR